MTRAVHADRSSAIDRVVDVAGVRTHYLEAGEGSDVVLIHGSGPGVSGQATWGSMLPVLASHGRVLAPDLVGFGETERPPGVSYGMGLWLDHLVGFLDGLKVDRASFVANSLGGALVLGLAAAVPERIDRLVLIGSAGLSFPITPGLEVIWGYEPSRAGMRRVLETLAFDPALVTDEIVDARYQASTAPGAHHAFATMFPSPRQRWVDSLATAEWRIAALPHRVLIVHGRDDPVVPLDVALRLLHLIQGAQLHVFGRCSHWATVECAGDLNRLVLSFLADDERRRPRC